MTSKILKWSSTAASNNATPPNGAPEGGTLVNQISDILRQIMAEVRAWWETPGWIDYGHTPTYSSGTIFTVTGNQTATYEVGRRVRAINSIGTTIYGSISASAYSATTSVTVVWDSGSLDKTVTEVAVSAASIASPWMSFKSLSGALARGQLPAEAIFQTGMTMPYLGATAPTGWVLWWGTIGNAASSATNRANADTEALFTLVWNTFANTEAAVSGGRGANAAADYAANKTIAVPDVRGRVIAALDNLGGTAANRMTSGTSGITGTTLGAAGGDERMHQHNHSITDNGHQHVQTANGNLDFVGANGTGSSVSGQGTSSFANTTNLQILTRTATTGIALAAAGSGGSQNVQPTIMLPYIIKL